MPAVAVVGRMPCFPEPQIYFFHVASAAAATATAAAAALYQSLAPCYCAIKDLLAFRGNLAIWDLLTGAQFCFTGTIASSCHHIAIASNLHTETDSSRT